MRRALILLTGAVLLVLSTCSKSSSPRSSSGSSSQRVPSWSEDKLNAAAAYAKEIGSAAVLVFHDGQVVFSFGDITRKYMCHSIRKPFLGALFGIYVEIGMEDFSPTDCTYVFELSKSKHPSYFFRMSSRDMARFGLLYQNYGRWGCKQIVPEKWIREVRQFILWKARGAILMDICGGSFQKRPDAGTVSTTGDSAFICWRSCLNKNSYSFIVLILICISISHGRKFEHL